MTVKTKFDIGDTCWVMINNKCECGVVKRLSSSVSREYLECGLEPDYGNKFRETKYTEYFIKIQSIRLFVKYEEHECFATKQELLNSL